MLLLSHKIGFAFGVSLALLAGCAESPIIKTSQQEVGPCEKLSIVQAGRETQPTNGIFHINREPFAVRYRGDEKDPALSASPDNQIVNALQLRGRKQLWASAGDYMAYSPNDLPLRSDFRLFVDEKTRNEFASMIGEKYPDYLTRAVLSNPELDTATFIPKAAGGFVPESSGNSYIFDVQTIHGQPVSQTRFGELYIAYFGTIERLGPPPRGFYSSQNLIKMNWGACLLAFNK